MADLVVQDTLDEIPFYGDTLEAIRWKDGVRVVIRRVCESLGVDFASQLTKLKKKGWAAVVMITTTARDGKKYEVATIPLKKLLVWLLNIDEKRIKPELRAKLEKYREECADVLEAHFFGARIAAQLPEAPTAVEKSSVGSMASFIEFGHQLLGQLDTLNRRQIDTESHVAQVVTSVDDLRTQLVSVCSVTQFIHDTARQALSDAKRATDRLDTITEETVTATLKATAKVVNEAMTDTLQTIGDVPGYLTVVQFYKATGRNGSKETAQRDGVNLTKLSRTNNVPIGNAPHAEHGSVHTYSIPVLCEYFKEDPKVFMARYAARRIPRT